MRKWLCFSLLLISSVAQTQTHTQTIRGQVLDKDSRIPLPGASVLVIDPDTSYGTSTDLDGNFRILKVPVGFHNIKASYIGYEESLLSNVLVGSGKETVVVIELIESVENLKEIVVKAGNRNDQPINELSVVSTQQFSVEETKRFAGSFDDPSRMALSFAGVTGGNNDEQNEIIIRGNSPRGLMWQLEGVEIPTPNHYADNGSSDGAVSILSSHMLANSDFSSGAFPAEYGNAISGVFDIRLRKGNNEKREYAFQASLLGFDAAIEGPFVKGKKASYLANYRYSTLALLNKMGLQIISGGVPVFQDLSFKLHFPTRKAGTISVFGIGGLSDIEEYEDGEITDSTMGRLWHMDSGSDLGVIGINHSYIVSPKFYVHSSLSFATQYIYNYRDELDEENVIMPFRREDLYTHYSKAQVTFNNKFNPRHQLKSGLIYTLQSYNLKGDYLADYSDTLVGLLRAKGSTHTMQGFVSWRYRITEKLTFISGVHGLYFDLTKHFSIEPRASITWSLPHHQRLSFGFGLHSRMEGLSVYLGKELQKDGQLVQHNRSLDFTKSLHYVLGYNNLIAPHCNLKVELYYMQHFNVPVSSDSSTFSLLNLTDGFVSEPLINEGTGRNYGVELTLEKYFYQKYFILLTASLYQSLYTGLDGVERSTRYNNNYAVNILGGKEFTVGRKKNGTLGLSTRIIVTGGRRYTPVDLQASEITGYAVIDPDDIYAESTPVYYRIDLSLYSRLNRKRVNMLVKVDLQNVTNRANVVDYIYSPRQNKMLTDRTGELVPVLGFKIEF